MVIDILAHPELKNYDLSSLRKGKFKFSPHNILRGVTCVGLASTLHVGGVSEVRRRGGGLARGVWGERALFTGRGTRSNYLHVKIELYFYILYITGNMNLLGHGMRKHF